MAKPLNYCPTWIERTFTNSQATAALLAPERDVGNVSNRDYDAALAFSPGAFPSYRFMAACLGIPLTFALRNRSWSLGRTFGVFCTTTVAGSLSGKAATFYAHLKFIHSLEDPSGFAQAIENIQTNSGLPVPPKSLIVSVKGNRSLSTDSEQSPIDTPSSTPATTPAIPNPSISPASKWDQIRAVNSRSSTNSSWDALRQRHERSSVPASTVSSQDDTDAFQRWPDEDRADQQAKFNEMLERERNMN